MWSDYVIQSFTEQAGTHFAGQRGCCEQAEQQQQARTDPRRKGGMAAPPAWPLGNPVHLSLWLYSLTLSLTEPSTFHGNFALFLYPESPLTSWSCLVALAHTGPYLPESPSLTMYLHSDTSCACVPFALSSVSEILHRAGREGALNSPGHPPTSEEVLLCL